jgi:hypothetical protein
MSEESGPALLHESHCLFISGEAFAVCEVNFGLALCCNGSALLCRNGLWCGDHHYGSREAVVHTVRHGAFLAVGDILGGLGDIWLMFDAVQRRSPKSSLLVLYAAEFVALLYNDASPTLAHLTCGAGSSS